MPAERRRVEREPLLRVARVELEERVAEVVAVEQGGVVVHGGSGVHEDLVEAEALDGEVPGGAGRRGCGLGVRRAEVGAQGGPEAAGGGAEGGQVLAVAQREVRARAQRLRHRHQLPHAPRPRRVVARRQDRLLLHA